MNAYLKTQTDKYPIFEIQDLIKFLYQGLFGAEHLISGRDTDDVRRYFYTEYQDTAPSDGPLTEMISDDYSRAHISPYKDIGADPEYLFRIFLRSAESASFDSEKMKNALSEIRSEFDGYGFPFSKSAFEGYCREYEEKGCPSVHHSQSFRDAYHPSYRIINNVYLNALKLLPYFRRSDKPFVVAVDGRCGSGKSTLSEQLSDIAGCSVIHMDDFYVPLKLRTEERYSVPGSNVHYERIISDILPKLNKKEDFSYPVFDFNTMDVGNTLRYVKGSDIYIVEGAYSLNPVFGNYYDFSVFYDIDPDKQLSRIKKRDPGKIDDFRNRWIPLEEEYISFYKIREKADVIINAL